MGSRAGVVGSRVGEVKGVVGSRGRGGRGGGRWWGSREWGGAVGVVGVKEWGGGDLGTVDV